MANTRFISFVADDFGMCEAVNEGIVQAFTEGLLTDTNLMAPTPCIDEALALTQQYAIPVGIHATFSCDWDLYGWGPMTNAPSLRAANGHFYQTHGDLWSSAIEEDVRRELQAQYEYLCGGGADIGNLTIHMAVDSESVFQSVLDELCREQNLTWRECRKAGVLYSRVYDWTSQYGISGESDSKIAQQKFLAYVRGLEPGYHLAVCHPAIDDDSLDTFCSPGHPARLWARTYRVVDLQLLLDPVVRECLEECGVECVPLSQVPVLTETTGKGWQRE